MQDGLANAKWRQISVFMFWNPGEKQRLIPLLAMTWSLVNIRNSNLLGKWAG